MPAMGAGSRQCGMALPFVGWLGPVRATTGTLQWARKVLTDRLIDEHTAAHSPYSCVQFTNKEVLDATSRCGDLQAT